MKIVFLFDTLKLNFLNRLFNPKGMSNTQSTTDLPSTFFQYYWRDKTYYPNFTVG